MKLWLSFVMMACFTVILDAGDVSLPTSDNPAYTVHSVSWRCSARSWAQIRDTSSSPSMLVDETGPWMLWKPFGFPEAIEEPPGGSASVELPYSEVSDWRGGVLSAQGQCHGLASLGFHHDGEYVGCRASVEQDVYGWVSSSSTDFCEAESLGRSDCSIVIDPIAEQITQAKIEVGLLGRHSSWPLQVVSNNILEAEWGFGQYLRARYYEDMNAWHVEWKYIESPEDAKNQWYRSGDGWVFGDAVYRSLTAYQRMGTEERLSIRSSCNRDTPYRGMHGWWRDGAESYRSYRASVEVKITDLRRVWSQ